MDEKSKLQEKILNYLNDNDEIPNSYEFVNKSNESHQLLAGIIRSLLVKNIVTYTESTIKFNVYSEQAKIIMNSTLPEIQFYNSLPDFNVVKNDDNNDDITKNPLYITREEAIKKSNITNIKLANEGFNYCMRNKWIKVEKLKQGKKKIIYIARANNNEQIVNPYQEIFKINDIEQLSKDQLKLLKARKYIENKSVLIYHIKKGDKFTNKLNMNIATDLNHELLKSNAWQDIDFKEYKFNHQESNIRTGCLHPLMKVRHEFRKILLQMGFSEMPTNNFVESSFLNFDSLFQPQQHPARDAHDTFFLKKPQYTLSLPDAAYVETVKNTHEHGNNYGSIGYRYQWSIEEAKKNILRTHTTAVSSRVLKSLANEYKKTGTFQPIRRFSIDRVFRNESLDPTHLAEFHQVEGFVADYNLTLADLIGTIKQFF